MVDLAIILTLVVSNAMAHSAYVRWRRKRGKRDVLKRVAAPRSLAYPTHPSPGFAVGFTPGFTSAPEHAVRPVGIDW
jgi:hypothetical protein